MSELTNLCTSFDVMKLLTDNHEKIDENDEDFIKILKCLKHMPEEDTDTNAFDAQNAESYNKIKRSNEKRDHISSYQTYPDYSQISEEALANKTSCIKGGSQEKFPTKLFKILELSDTSGYSSIISWLPHGRAFKIHNKGLFKEYIMKKYFFQTKFTSFKRQLYVYGFRMIGKRFDDFGAYYHESFIRGKLNLCRQMPRWTGKKSRSSYNPNFHKMPEIVPDINNCNSSDESIGEIERVSEPKVVQYVVSDFRNK